MPQMLQDGEIAKGVNSLNSKQREVFNVVHKWAKDYVKCNGHNIEPVYIFLSGSWRYFHQISFGESNI